MRGKSSLRAASWKALAPGNEPYIQPTAVGISSVATPSIVRSPSGGVAMRPLDLDPTRWAIPPPAELGSHHARHALSRRAFLGSMARMAGAALGAGLLPTRVLAPQPSSPMPKP